jgi:hypothetical protein
LLQIDLIPPQRDEFADPQTVPVGEQDERRIAVAVPTNPARCANQPLDLLRRQVLARSPFTVRNAPGRGDFPVCGAWRRVAHERKNRPLRAG